MLEISSPFIHESVDLGCVLDRRRHYAAQVLIQSLVQQGYCIADSKHREGLRIDSREKLGERGEIGAKRSVLTRSAEYKEGNRQRIYSKLFRA